MYCMPYRLDGTANDSPSSLVIHDCFPHFNSLCTPGHQSADLKDTLRFCRFVASTPRMNPAWSQACVCGRTFTVPQGLSCHQRSCLKAKKRLSDALKKAREVLRGRKRRKIDLSHQAVEGSSNQNVSAEPLSNVNSLLPDHPQVRTRVRSTLWLMKGFVEH